MRQTLIEVLPNKTSAIITALENFAVPWKNNTYYVPSDMDYVFNHAGTKYISRLTESLLNTQNVLTDNALLILANVIFKMFSRKWDKLYNTYTLEYDPIENYHMLETMTDDITEHEYGHTNTRTDNLTHGKTGNETLTHNTTDTRTDNLTHTKTGDETITHNTTDTRTDNLTHGKTGDETLTHNTTDTRTDNLSHTKTGDETITHNTTETRTDNLTADADSGIYGFNSSLAVPSTTAQSHNTGTQANAKTGTEVTDYDLTEQQTGTQANAKTGTEQTAYNISETETGTQANAKTGTEKTDYDLTEQETGTQTNAKTGTEQTAYNISDTQTGTVTDREGGTNTDTRNYTLERSGNIGVTTSQQMIESERKLWEYDFISMVYADIDRVLTIDYYGGGC